MTEPSSLSANKQALLKIRELKDQLAAMEREGARSDGTVEPIAVVSMACRFPNTADTPEKFWQSLIRQDDLVGDIPEDRWDMDAFYDEDPEVPGKMYARRGVFLDNLSQMDPEFFGVSPREATWVDPQQRLLMEVGWEAIERAGWIPEEIGDHTGVFVGWMHNDYQNEASDSFLNLNPYIATGAAGSFLSGRLAWHLGLKGPSLAVDTACSSSLVALHLAIQSLSRRECDRALVGGVNAICSPTTNILTCKLKALSPSGHSRAFDAAADGYLRGEGCGVLTLRRLADAQRDGDQVLGIIRASAIGHNGAGSGLTVPNPKAQEDVIRKALQRAGLDAKDVDYLEAHGTGTSLGDPIEVNAAAAAYCQQRTSDQPLLIGSVKTNIGHLEAAAGMAGLIKVLLSFQKGSIPGQMNFETPNPHIAWDKTPVKVLTEETAWPNAAQRRAGVSAFGMSGTNAHVILEAPDSVFASAAENQSPHDSRTSIVTLSGKTEDAVLDLAESWAGALAVDESIDLSSLARQSNVARSHFEHRAAFATADRAAAKQLLQTLARGGKAESLFVGSSRRSPRIAWQFTGQGAQFVGMGRQLYESQPIYRDVIDQCDAQLSDLGHGSGQGSGHGSLLQVLYEDDSDSPQINNTHWTQPAIFACQMGLVKLLQSWGLNPDIVLGHSVGQYAAACVAGVMSWESGLRLIAERGRLIGELPHGGLMMAVFAPADAIARLIENENAISIAAHNGTHIVISGESDAIKRVEAELSSRGIKSKILTTSHAFHSHLMEPVLEPFAKVADSIEFSSPQMPLICNVSAKVLASDAKIDGKYWAAHIRENVAFAPSIEVLAEMDCDLLVEIGPQSVLTRMAASRWSKGAQSLVSCLEKDLDDNAALANAIARQYVHGVRPNFRAMHADSSAPNVDLPTYPFQRRRFWGPDKPRAAHAEFHTAHPLLGSKISLAGAGNESRFESHIDVDSPSWMPDHEVMNSTVLPGAALLEMAIEAAEDRTIENVVFEQPIRPTGRTSLQTVIRKSAAPEPDGGEPRDRLETFARASNSQNWQRHFSCDLVSGQKQRPAAVEIESLASGLPETESPEAFYEKMNSLGLNYGPAFRCITQLRFSETEVLANLQVAGDVRGYNFPPTILDAALHSLAVGLLRSGDDHLFLPVGIGKLAFFAPIETEAVCHATWKQNEGKNRSADLKILSTSGELLLAVEDLKVQQVSLSALRQMSAAGAERLVFDLRWKPNRLPATKLEPKNWLLVGATDSDTPESQFARKIQARLSDEGHQVLQLEPAETREGWIANFETHATDDDQPFFDGIVWLAAKDDGKAVFSANARSLVAFTQAMIEKSWRKLPCGVLLVTQDAIAVEETQPAVPLQTQLWGLARVISAEQPELRCRMVDLCPQRFEDSSTIDSVADLAQTETNDNQFAIRDGQLLSPRMGQTRLPKSDQLEADPQGAYLVTGGLGKLGRHAAKWLADRGAGQVVLVSRRQPDDETLAFIDTIKAAGCEAIVHAADISQRSDVESLFKRFGTETHPLKGVIHAAGVLDDGLIESQTEERFEKVLQPKIVAARLLDELTRELELDFFVLYSSAASVLGSPGQSNYATGNAFLDGLVWQRRAAKLPALAINWGPWTEGMADDERILKRLALQGITPLGIEEAHSAMEKMIANETVQATVMDVDWRKMRIGPLGDVPAMLQELAGPKRKGRAATSALVSKLRSLRGNAKRELLLKTVQDSLQQILSTPEAPETDRPLIELGLDSLMAVEFGTELQQMLGDQFNVGPTMLFDHPTIDSICDHVLELVQADSGNKNSESPAVTVKGTPTTESTAKREDIAVIGMSCRFPGARDIHEFWQNLLDGVDSVGDIPSDRWDVDRFYSEDREPGKMYSRQGGFLDDIADFDARFFNISDQEACWIDPQHRMLLENSYRAMEDAGVPTSPLTDPNVGVFMGIMGSDYAFLPKIDDDYIIKGFQGAGLSHSAGVGRISYTFGFEGPSVSVDTASSSSLVAVYQAMRSLQEGNCNMALAGGVNAILVPVNSLLMSKAGLLSPDGRCKSFSKSADGFGRGEGCGVVVLKRLSDAQRDGDRVMAVIRGGAVVHNGFSGGITAPSGKAQSRVIGAAIKDAGISPARVQYLEAHGTGTEFGDPMEIGAAMKVYAKGRNKKNPLLIGSVKANISHLEAAGGSSGLIKTILALHHGMIPQQIHFDEPSQHIPWKRMPAKMVTENTPWPECEQPTAGITALGLVGTNAHLILSSPQESDAASTDTEQRLDSSDESEPKQPRQRLLVASARCDKSLAELKLRYANWLEQNPLANLDDFCCTLAAGRRHHEHRVAFGFSSAEEAIERLRGKPQNGNGKLSTTPIPNAVPKISWIFADDHGNCESELQQLRDFSPVVDTFLNECEQRLSQHAGDDSIPLSERLKHSDELDASESTAGLLPFLLQASLCKLWQSWGIGADSAFGIGVGQYTAACSAGCLCFLDAMVLVYERDQWRKRGSNADELADFEKLADQFNFYPPNLPLWCSLANEIVPTHRSLGGSYWRQHLEQQPEIDQTLSEINAINSAKFELGLIAGKSDQETLSRLSGSNIVQCIGVADSVAAEMTALLAKLYQHGYNPDFNAVFQSSTRTPLSLPVYPFQKKRYWITEIADHMPIEDQLKTESTLT